MTMNTCPHCGEPLKRPKGRPYNSIWTDELEDELRRLWARGSSCSEIADELGFGLTRNAIIGKAHRLKLTTRATFQRKPEPVKRVRRRKPSDPGTISVARHSNGFKRSSEKVSRRPKPEPPPVISLLGPVSFLSCPETRCKFIADDPRAQPITALMCCGEEVRPGSRYCPHHYARTHERYILPADAATYREKAAA